MRRALPYLVFGAISLACFWRFLFLGWTLYDVRSLEGHLGTRAAETRGWFASHRPPVDRGDTILLLPMLHKIYTDGLHHAELRLWNPSLFCGYPLYNDPQIHPFYPPNLILHALLPARIAYDFNVLLHFFFAGAAMYWLLRGSGRSEPAATLGGVLWMLLGYNTLWVSTGILMGASVFAPLALLLLQKGLARREFKPLALGGLCQGLVLLGSHAQYALLLMIFFSIWILVSWIRDRAARPFLLKGAALFAGSALGVGMAAILTQLDAVMNGLRVPGDDLMLHYPMPWTQPLYIAGVAMGKVCAPTGPLGALLRSEFTIYAGVAGTLLAVLGAVRGFRDPWTRFLAIFSAATLLVFVKPVAELLLQIPFLNLGMPARWVYIFGFCLTLLAASGLDALREDPARSFRLLAAGAAGCLLVLGIQYGRGPWVESLIGLALAGAWILTARRAPRLSLAFCFAATVLDLLPGFVLFNRHADPAPLEQNIFGKNSDLEPWRATGSVRLKGPPGEVNGWTVSIGNNLLAFYGMDAPMGYEAIAPLATAQYCYAMNGERGIMGSGRVLALINMKSRLVDLANVKYIFMPWAFEPEPRFKEIEPYSALSAPPWYGALRLYDNTAALPRAYLVSRSLRAADENEAARLLESKDLDPRTTVVLQATDVPRTSEGGGTVTWTSRGTDRLELQVDAKADSILVVSDTDYPGWAAELDGIATPILRANLAFRAVAVPAGSHRVVMKFRPSSARNGLLLSGLSTVALLAFCGRRKRSLS
ncbi:MAG TPA: YfhO family protein [Planctomycetota bacterium]|nr:YfhO family protein [Planctomycetota bacterium]